MIISVHAVWSAPTEQAAGLVILFLEHEDQMYLWVWSTRYPGWKTLPCSPTIIERDY